MHTAQAPQPTAQTNTALRRKRPFAIGTSTARQTFVTTFGHTFIIRSPMVWTAVRKLSPK